MDNTVLKQQDFADAAGTAVTSMGKKVRFYI